MVKKKNILNKNSLPFLILTLVHFTMLLILLKRKKLSNVWLLLLSNMGFAYLFEYIILNLFQSYRYKPSIFKKRDFDNILGAILSQGIYVPISATFLTLFKMNWGWKISFSFFYYLIEKLFIQLKIYKVYWWKPIYTLTLLNVYFSISDAFNKALTHNRKWAMQIAHYLSIEVIGVSLMYVSAVIRQIRFGYGKLHTWREHFMLAPLYSFGLSYIGMKNSIKPGILIRLLMLFYTIAIDISLSRLGILKINYRQILGSIPYHIFMIVITRLLYLKIFQKEKATS